MTQNRESEDNPRLSCKIFQEDAVAIHKFKGELIVSGKKWVSFPTALHFLLTHYFKLVQELEVQKQAREIIKNAKNIEEE